MALEYVPAEGKVAIQILGEVDDDDDADEASASSGYPTAAVESDEALLAICCGVGPKVTVCKTGDTVYVYPWAKSGLCVGDSVHIIDAYAVAAKVKQ